MKGRTLKRLAIKALIFAKKASPYVLAVLSAAGTVAVTVEAVKEIKKNEVEEVPEENNENKTKFEIVKDKTIKAAKLYWKPITFCVGSIVCQAGSVFIFTKRQQRLLIATHQLERLIERYNQALGVTAATGGVTVANKLAPTEYPEDSPVDVDNDGKVLFWDPIFDYWFRTSQLYFTEAAYQTCVDFCMYGGASVNRFYECMDVTPPIDDNKDGYVGWGWYVDDDYRWNDYYGEACGFIGITYSKPMTTPDGLEYREVMYYHTPMFNMNGEMYDHHGKSYFGF